MTPNATPNDMVHDQYVLAVPPEWLNPVGQTAIGIKSEWGSGPAVCMLETPEAAISEFRQAVGRWPRHLVIVSHMLPDVRRPAHLAEYRSRIGCLAVENAPDIRVNAVLVQLPDTRADSMAQGLLSVAGARIVLDLARALTGIGSVTGQTLHFDARCLAPSD